jgi:hypothetical protein
MANSVVIGLKHDRQNGGWNTRFGMSTRRIVGPGYVGLAMAIFTASPAQAQMTGYDLYQKCTASTDTVNGSIGSLTCTAYIVGFMGGLVEAAKVSQLPGYGIGACPSANVAMGQYELIFQRWGAQHPEWLAHPAHDVLAAAIIAAFPCQQR